MDTNLLIGLMVVWGLTYILGMVFRKPNAKGDKRIPLWTKLVMIGITLILAFYPIISTPDLLAGPALWIIVALVLGAIGDLVLANVFPLKHPELAGMGVFGIGHFAFIAALLMIWATVGSGIGGLIASVVGGVIFVLIGWRFLIYNPEGKKSLNIGSLVYGILLFIVVGIAVGLSINGWEVWMFPVGIGLFAISDIILAQSMIQHRGTPLMRDIVWIIYSGGQMLIAYSVGQVL